jgi:hypothetical protein
MEFLKDLSSSQFAMIYIIFGGLIGMFLLALWQDIRRNDDDDEIGFN